MKVFDITALNTWAYITEYYANNGYVVIQSGLDSFALNQLAGDLDQWFTNDSFPSQDYAVKDDNRIQDAWRFDPRIKSFATASHIRKLLSTLYNGDKVTPFQTLNFRVGTQQPAHSDSIHFNSEPFGMMCGVWLALEDIDGDQGPLVYYPGSHKLPEMNFDALGLSPKGNDFQEYSHAIRKVIDTHQLKPAYATLKQGQALIWSANLLHGGSLRKSDKTRLSQVTHYYVEGCKYWRPSLSYTERHYFDPHWIPLRDKMVKLKNINRLASVLKNKLFSR